MLAIRLYGDPVLREKSKPVGEITDDVRDLAREMLVAMYAKDGVGLAAPQVGVLKRLIVVDPEPKEGTRSPMVLIDPVILERQGEAVAEEGCLSLPEIFGEVSRAETVRVSMRDLDGQEQTFTAEGWLARVIQHEVDHLDGVLFIDHMSRMQRQVLRGPLKKLRERSATR